MPLFSFIIPIYNVEKYIDNCLQSIYNQEIDKNIFEVIAVNDGTPDNSIEIVNRYKEKYNNLTVINKANGGVSSARNVGIEQSNGEYIIFVDGDDSIFDNSIKRILDTIHGIDSVDMLVTCSFTSQVKEEKYAWKDKFEENKKYSLKDLLEKKYERGSVCGVVFNRLFLIKNNIKFPLNVHNGEDTIFFSTCLACLNKLAFSYIPLYSIYEREGSASRCTYSLDRLEKNIKGLDFLDMFLNKGQYNNYQRDVIQLCKYRIISNIIYQSNNLNIKYKDFNNIAKLYRYLPIKVSTKIYPQILLLNCSSYLFYLLSMLKHKVK